MGNKNHRRSHAKLRNFKIYYFTGDYWSSEGETMKSAVIRAESEEDAEEAFCSIYNINAGNIGYIEEVS